MLNGLDAYFIQGNWFDVDEEKVNQKFVDLLHESRRMPDFALFLTADEPTIVNRLLDIPKITEEYERLAAARRQELAD